MNWALCVLAGTGRGAGSFWWENQLRGAQIQPHSEGRGRRWGGLRSMLLVRPEDEGWLMKAGEQQGKRP